MKSLHLYLSTLLPVLVFQPANAGIFDRQPGLYVSTEPSYFRPVSQVGAVFRGQSNDAVPIPPNSGVQPNSVPSGGSVPLGSTIFPDSTLGTTTQPLTTQPLTTQPLSGGSSPGSTFANPVLPEPSTWNAFSPPISSDPFLTDPNYGQVAPYAPYAPYGATNGQPVPFSTYGTNGPQPYRQGWQNRLDVEWLPETAVTGRPGNFEQFGVDYDLTWTGPFMPGWLMQWTNEFRLRNWDGPQGVPGLPSSAYRFGWDFELETPKTGPVGFSMGVTPSLNTDFEGSLSSTAFQLDGRAMFIFTLDQYWSAVVGAAWWDRVDDRLIPWAGLVYRDDYWEWRIMYPETTISLFLGNESQWAKWMYVRAEYHVEAYEVSTGNGGMDEVELSDYRILTGFKMNAGLYSWFIEAGYVFDREVDYGLAANGKYAPENGFITRLGVRY